MEEEEKADDVTEAAARREEEEELRRRNNLEPQMEEAAANLERRMEAVFVAYEEKAAAAEATTREEEEEELRQRNELERWMEAGNNNNIGDFGCIRERVLRWMRFIMLILVFAICHWYFFCLMRRFSVSVCHPRQLITSNETPVLVSLLAIIFGLKTN